MRNGLLCRVVLLVLLLAAVGGLSGCLGFLNRPPEAVFVVTYDVDPEDPLVVQLDASLSTDPDGDAITTYQWVFGDDVEILTPLAYTKTVHVPTLLIRYPDESDQPRTVQLLVLDEHGKPSDPVLQQVTVPNITVEPTL